MAKTILLFVSILALPAIAAAQVSSADEIDNIRRNARVHAGPFYASPSLHLKELGVDSNVFNAAGEQVSDFTFTVAPKVDVFVPVARRILTQGTVATDLVWYSRYERERSMDPEVGLRSEIYLGRLTLFGDAHWASTRQRMNYEIDARSRHQRQDAGVGAQIRLTRKLSVEAMALRGATRFDADARFDGTSLQRTLNQTMGGMRATVRQRLTPLTTIAVRYDRQHDAFEFSPLRDSRSYRVMPGVEFTPRALIKGTAYVGYRRFTPSVSTHLPEFSGMVADLVLSYTLLGSTTVGISYRRDVTYSYEELQPFFVNNSAGASVRRAIGRRFDVLVSADRHRYDYRDLLLRPVDAGAPPFEARLDTSWNYAGSLGYRVGRTGRIGFGASYWQRESTTKASRDYQNLRIGATATYAL